MLLLRTRSRRQIIGLIRRTQADVWRFVAHLVDQRSADDLTQEVYLRAVPALARFRGDAAEPGGIGLALVRRTVAVHGGRAWIGPSSLGRGTAVHVVWPKRPAVAA